MLQISEKMGIFWNYLHPLKIEPHPEQVFKITKFGAPICLIRLIFKLLHEYK